MRSLATQSQWAGRSQPRSTSRCYPNCWTASTSASFTLALSSATCTSSTVSACGSRPRPGCLRASRQLLDPLGAAADVELRGLADRPFRPLLGLLEHWDHGAAEGVDRVL